MKLAPNCVPCLYEKQEQAALLLEETPAREAFLQEIHAIMEQRDPEISAPELVALFTECQRRHGIPEKQFPKERFNRIILEREADIEESIEKAADPLVMAMAYARVGNYIDFGAMNDVSEDLLLKLIAEVERSPLDPVVCGQFLEACAGAEKFLLCCDNCGEIVLDKLFVKQLQKRFPGLDVTVLVRGQEVLNDATLEDARMSGMTEIARVVGNGSPIAGTVYEKLSPEARTAFEEADVVLAKGQGNYESLAGTPANREKAIFYSFLCKCELFTERFGVAKYTGMLVKG